MTFSSGHPVQVITSPYSLTGRPSFSKSPRNYSSPLATNELYEVLRRRAKLTDCRARADREPINIQRERERDTFELARKLKFSGRLARSNRRRATRPLRGETRARTSENRRVRRDSHRPFHLINTTRGEVSVFSLEIAPPRREVAGREIPAVSCHCSANLCSMVLAEALKKA